jgi:hypothetical protein
MAQTSQVSLSEQVSHLKLQSTQTKPSSKDPAGQVHSGSPSLGEAQEEQLSAVSVQSSHLASHGEHSLVS